MRMKIPESCISILILSVFCFLSGCTLQTISDEEAILELYADVMRAYSREDIRGVMEPIDKDFSSDVEFQADYDELKSARAEFILKNSNVKIDFKDIQINISESDAIVQYKVMLETDQISSSWHQIDTLKKDGSDWKIISWRVSGEAH